MEPITEWTDDELAPWNLVKGVHPCRVTLAAEVLRLRAALATCAYLSNAATARANAAEENLAFAQQRAADNDLRARLAEAKVAELRNLGGS